MEFSEMSTWTPSQDSPLFAVHYMPWFNNPETSERGRKEWSHWACTDGKTVNDPLLRDADGQRGIASVDYPLIGPYSSDDPDVVRYHFRTMRSVGIDAVFIIWYGPGSDTDQLVPMLLDEAERAGLRLAICYEEKLNWPEYRNPESRADIVNTATDDLNYILSEYSGHPAYLHRGQKPFIYQFNFWGEGDLGKNNILPAEWEQVFSSLDQSVAYARQNLNPEYHPEIGGAYVWWSEDESYLRDFAEYSRSMVDADRLEFFMTMAAPGFDDSGVNGWGHGARVSSDRGPGMLQKTLEIAVEGDPEVIQLVTWNDFNEGTALEPTVRFGYQYLDALEEFIASVTGRSAEFSDNRSALREYLKRASEKQRVELAPGVEEYLEAPMSQVDEAQTQAE